MSDNLGKSKSSTTRCSLFASPATTKTKKFANVSVLENPNFEQQEEEPMEIDAVEEKEPQNSENQSTSTSIITTTPRRKSIPSAGRRRSARVSKEDINAQPSEPPKTVIQNQKPVEQIAAPVVSQNSSVFELIQTEDPLSSEQLLNIASEHNALLTYKSELDGENQKYNAVLQKFEKSLKNARERADAPYLIKYKKYGQEMPNLEELERNSITSTLSIMTKFRELTANTLINAKMQKEVDKESKKNDVLEEKMKLINDLLKKYEVTQEIEEEKERKIQSLMSKLEKTKLSIEKHNNLVPIISNQLLNI